MAPAQAPAYYYYTAADDSTYGYDDSAYAYGYDDAYGHAQCTKSNIVAARLRHGSITASTPSTRRQLDGVAVWSLSARFSLSDGILAEEGLSEELSGAPDSPICAQVMRGMTPTQRPTTRTTPPTELMTATTRPITRTMTHPTEVMMVTTRPLTRTTRTITRTRMTIMVHLTMTTARTATTETTQPVLRRRPAAQRGLHHRGRDADPRPRESHGARAREHERDRRAGASRDTALTDRATAGYGNDDDDDDDGSGEYSSGDDDDDSASNDDTTVAAADDDSSTDDVVATAGFSWGSLFTDPWNFIKDNWLLLVVSLAFSLCTCCCVLYVCGGGGGGGGGPPPRSAPRKPMAGGSGRTSGVGPF